MIPLQKLRKYHPEINLCRESIFGGHLCFRKNLFFNLIVGLCLATMAWYFDDLKMLKLNRYVVQMHNQRILNQVFKSLTLLKGFFNSDWEAFSNIHTAYLSCWPFRLSVLLLPMQFPFFFPSSRRFKERKIVAPFGSSQSLTSVQRDTTS